MKKLPLLITRQDVVFPKLNITIDAGRDISLAAIIDAKTKQDGMLVVVAQKDATIEKVTPSDLYAIGVEAKILNVIESHEQMLTVTLMPLNRVKISTPKKVKGMYVTEYSVIREQVDVTNTEKKLVDEIKKLIKEKLVKTGTIPPTVIEAILNITNVSEFVDTLAFQLPFSVEQKQTILETTKLNLRLKKIVSLLNSESTINKIESDISKKIKDKLNDQQREFYLREKMRAIKEELDEISGAGSEIEELRKRVEENPYPKVVKEKVLKEINKLENSMPISAESNVIRTYVDWLLDLPYWQKDEEKIEIKKAKVALDKDHWGLEKVKERIIEYLAVRQVNENASGTVLCLVGPPGTGKTTLAKSIAQALNRKFIKIALGGVRDEAEIRGHRRTYIGAMPGKVITAMKKAQVVNPLILLDEIDKMASDLRGDPTAALLEVLDYEQNTNFQDHYIEEDYDLSNVMFIATANYFENIPEPLIDRLEIIQLSSYTELEKIHIAKDHLIPNVASRIPMKKGVFKFNDEIIKYLIRHYTMEAGVRGLSRVLETIARKIVVLEINNKLKKGNFKINEEQVHSLLGKQKFDFTKREKKKQVGVATGLAWTAYGGDVLPIEVTLFPGKGELILTGQQRDIMKESANIALGYVKSHAKIFGIESNLFKDNDIHIHVPDGATPKDGPSAGITFTTALISALTSKPISPYIGMTGEISLRGNVMPIGGLKEKSISGYRSGLTTILIPKENEKDLDDIPKEVRKNLKIISVSSYSEVFKNIFKD